jgi:anti-anti-sigma regulatory factor
MAITVQHMKECSLVLLQGRIEAADCLFLKDALRIASLSRNKSVWVDCEHIASVSAKALRRMRSLAGRAKAAGVSLLFYQMPPAVRKAAKEPGASTELHIVASIADASNYCRESRVPSR